MRLNQSKATLARNKNKKRRPRLCYLQISYICLAQGPQILSPSLSHPLTMFLPSSATHHTTERGSQRHKIREYVSPHTLLQLSELRPSLSFPFSTSRHQLTYWTSSRAWHFTLPPVIMRVRGWSSAAAALLPPCALLLSRANSAWAAPATLFADEKSGAVDERLAVVVPCHDGDLERALASVARWPKACSPVTLSNVDLILYKAEGDEESAETILPALQQTAGQCFANTKIVYGHLADEVSRSVLFF